MKSLTIVVCLLFIASCATQKADSYTGLSDSELNTLFAQAKKEQPLQYCKKLVPITKALLQRDASSQKKKAFRDYATFKCALDEQRWNDAYTSMVRYEQRSGVSMGAYGFNLAYFTGHYEDAVERLESIGPDNYSSDIFGIDPELFWRFFSRVESDGGTRLQKRAIDAMVQSPYFNGLEVDFRSSLAAQKLRFEAQSGNFEDSDKWIASLLRPADYLSMLADRRFAPVWPELERAAGEHFTDVNERHLKAVKQAYQQDTADLEAYQRLAHALVFAGKFEQAVEFVKTPADKDFATIEEEEAWALNMKIDALDALGRTEEGTALFKNLATIAVNDDNRHWLINFTINRAERLASYGHWAKALDAVAYAEGFSGSDYARSIIRRVKVCALAGQGEDVSALLADVYHHRKDSYTNAAMAMVCAGDKDMAAELMVEALNDESERAYAIEALQNPQFSFYMVRPETPNLHKLIDTNQPLRAAFEKEARLIPKEYIPQARLKSL